LIRYLLADASEVPEGAAWLAPLEADFQQRLHIPQRRADWRLGRWAAKQAVAAWLDAWHEKPIAPERIAIRPAPDGAPEILLDGAPATLAISFSHRAGRALCMLAPAGTLLGCDLELVEPRSDEFIDDYLTAAERDFVKARSEQDQPLLANLLWSAKESALKALRTGLRMDTRSVEAELGDYTANEPGWQPLCVRRGETQELFRGWWQREGAFLLTVCVSPALEVPMPLFSSRAAGYSS
jgi:4'-phosphopantetheinyl transferase